MSRYAQRITGAAAAWFAVSIAFSALHFYKTGPDQPPAIFGIAVLSPVLLFLAGFVSSRRFKEFALSLNPRTLTFVQSLRLEGFVFLVLASYGILPRMFALSAGWGDITIGATAAFAAIYLAKPAHRRSFIFWQILGITDLVTAVVLGTLARFIEPHGVATTAMTVLPLSVIPTFAVPLFLILHLICIAQALRWPAQEVPRPVSQGRFQPETL